MQLTISEIEDKFTPLQKEKLLIIKGGDGIKLSDDQLKQMFDYTQAGGFNSTVSQTFNFAIRQMAATDVGASLLRTIASATTAKINVSSAPPPPDANASYSPSDNVLRTGNLQVVHINSDTTNAGNLSNISHEMYHALKDLFYYGDNGTVSTHVYDEIEAFLFSAKVLQQFDQLNANSPTPKTYSDKNGPLSYLNSSLTPTDPVFLTAFNNVLNNPNFTLADYNTLISGFKDTAIGNAYSSLSTTPFTSLNDIRINKILFNHGEEILLHENNQIVITPSGEYSGGFGVDWNDSTPMDNPYEWGFNSNITFISWYDFNTQGEYSGDILSPTEISAYLQPYNNTDFIWEYQNGDGVIQYISPGDPLSIVQSGFAFYESQDPNNPHAYDPDGYDPNGCDEDGYGRDGRNSNGYDREGYDIYGYDKDGYDEDGYDIYGYDEDGYDEDGYDEDGYDIYGVTREENGDY